MLEGKTRIPPVDVETLPDDLRETLEEQRKLRGAPLYPYLFYARNAAYFRAAKRSEEHTSELQSPCNLVCRLLLEKKKKTRQLLICTIRAILSIANEYSCRVTGDSRCH